MPCIHFGCRLGVATSHVLGTIISSIDPIKCSSQFFPEKLAAAREQRPPAIIVLLPSNARGPFSTSLISAFATLEANYSEIPVLVFNPSNARAHDSLPSTEASASILAPLLGGVFSTKTPPDASAVRDSLLQLGLKSSEGPLPGLAASPDNLMQLRALLSRVFRTESVVTPDDSSATIRAIQLAWIASEGGESRLLKTAAHELVKALARSGSLSQSPWTGSSPERQGRWRVIRAQLQSRQAAIRQMIQEIDSEVFGDSPGRSGSYPNALFETGKAIERLLS